MEEAIQTKGQEVSIIIYDAPLPPKYFRFSKKFIRSVFVGVPLLLGTLLGAAFIWGLGQRLERAPAPTMPVSLPTTTTSVSSGLEEEIKTLKQSNADLVAKLNAAGTTTGTAEERYLMAIKRPYGMQDLTKEARITVDQFSLDQTSNKTSFKFQIINSKADSKVTGHIIVFMVSDSGVMAYPKEANQGLAEGIKYSSGEPFAASRLRPTSADFLHRLTGSSVKFVIYVFTREGDLLLQQESPSYKVEPKS